MSCKLPADKAESEFCKVFNVSLREERLCIASAKEPAPEDIWSSVVWQEAISSVRLSNVPSVADFSWSISVVEEERSRFWSIADAIVSFISFFNCDILSLTAFLDSSDNSESDAVSETIWSIADWTASVAAVLDCSFASSVIEDFRVSQLTDAKEDFASAREESTESSCWLSDLICPWSDESVSADGREPESVFIWPERAEFSCSRPFWREEAPATSFPEFSLSAVTPLSKASDPSASCETPSTYCPR